jgi:type IV pilus assembly protein PilM
MTIPDMRLMLKHSAKTYLQQDLTDFVYDCYILPQQFMQRKQAEGDKKPLAQKVRVVVAAAKKSVVDMFQAGAKIAKVTIENLVPEVICPINAFEFAQPEDFRNAVVALVDIGFKKSSISILIKGELVLNRIVHTGGDTLTNGLSESMGITYIEAENIKIGMPQEVRLNLEPMISSLGRELRASLDFCEHQFNVTVEKVYLSGGMARSEFVVNLLQAELMGQCKLWNPFSFMEIALPPHLVGECEHVAPQLAVAVGAAACSF